jgi:hypothetical protein
VLGDRLGPAPLQVDQGQQLHLGAGAGVDVGQGVGDPDHGPAAVRPEHGGHDHQAARVGPGLHGPEQPDHLVEAEHGPEAAVAPPQPQAPGELVGAAEGEVLVLDVGDRAGQAALRRVGDQRR